MSKEVKRYTFFAYLDDDVAELDCHESEDGEYVRWGDYEPLLAERDGANERAEMILDAKNHWADRARAVECQRDQLRAEVGALRALLIKSLPIVEAHAGASHMLEGFRPTRNKWDELVDEIRAAMSVKEA